MTAVGAPMHVADNAHLNMAGSYYGASAIPFAPAPTLEGEQEADLCVVGAGATGLSAALKAAETGMSVIVLEAGRIGWGASGRNGGQIIPGLRKGAVELIAKLGRQEAKALLVLAHEARERVLDRIAKHRMNCDLRTGGHVTLAAKPGDLIWMRAEAEALNDLFDASLLRVLSRPESEELVQASGFHGGLFDTCGGHLHPLNFTLGLADAAREAGARLYERSPALRLEPGAPTIVHSNSARVHARHVILACDALIGDLSSELAARIMPVANYLVATEQLERTDLLMPPDLAVSDSRFVVNYFRMSADGRLIFGGGERYTPKPPPDIPAFVRPYMLKIFPQLERTRIDYAWGGLVSITMTRLPHIGRLPGSDVYFAHGYSGQGVLMSVLGGEMLVDAMNGASERMERFARLAPPAFPGGASMRGPLHVLGMAWYALRDRL